MHCLRTSTQVGSITCDNASNNDTMLVYLGNDLPGFRGARHHVRCFAHTLNLTAKAITRQFEVRPQRDGADVIAIQTAEDRASEDLLRRLAGELDMDETDVIGGGQTRDDEEGFMDEVNQMNANDLLAWRRNVQPIRSALIKVSNLRGPSSDVADSPWSRPARFHSRLSTPQRCSFPAGSRRQKTVCSPVVCFLEMCRHGGILLMTCSLHLSPCEASSTLSRSERQMVCGIMSWTMRNGTVLPSLSIF